MHLELSWGFLWFVWRRSGAPNPLSGRLSAPAAIAGAVKDMQADSRHLDHRAAPVRPDVSGVIMGRIANLRQVDLASRHRHGDFLGGPVNRHGGDGWQD